MVKRRILTMLKRLWEELATEARGMSGSGTLKRLIDNNSGRMIFAGVKPPAMVRVLILSVKKENFPLKKDLPQPKGFSLTIDTPEQNLVNLVLSVSAPLYNEVFLIVANDLYEGIRNTPNEASAATAFLSRVYQWQTFFDKRPPEGLSPEEQRGLYGELYFLKSTLLPSSADLLFHVESWTGPLGRQHDFQFGETAVEVKTSSSKQHQIMLITGEQQLDETLVNALYVFFVSLSIIENNGNTLPALIKDIRSALSGQPQAQLHFENALFERGYLDAQENKYTKAGYNIRESCIFDVSGDFPRLTARDLPRGVGDLQYSVSIDECRKYAVTENDLLDKIHRKAT
jgi:hypothetical protein